MSRYEKQRWLLGRYNQVDQYADDHHGGDHYSDDQTLA